MLFVMIEASREIYSNGVFVVLAHLAHQDSCSRGRGEFDLLECKHNGQ